ncbi:hypothetical protein SNE40_014242 [Patella caerulea]
MMLTELKNYDVTKPKKNPPKIQPANPEFLSAENVSSDEENIDLYCICSGVPRKGNTRMVACDSTCCPNRPYEWFHFSCMKIKNEPMGKWYCPDCSENAALIKIRERKKKTTT